MLHARTKEEAVAVLERVKFRFELAIIDLGLPNIDGWDLIGLLTQPPRRVMKTLVATFGHTEGFARQVRALGVDVVAPRGMALNEWRTAVEEALLK